MQVGRRCAHRQKREEVFLIVRSKRPTVAPELLCRAKSGCLYSVKLFLVVIIMQQKKIAGLHTPFSYFNRYFGLVRSSPR